MLIKKNCSKATVKHMINLEILFYFLYISNSLYSQRMTLYERNVNYSVIAFNRHVSGIFRLRNTISKLQETTSILWYILKNGQGICTCQRSGKKAKKKYNILHHSLLAVLHQQYLYMNIRKNTSIFLYYYILPS